MAPNYGCCTANFNQGWPKFVQHLVFAHSDGHGLVVAMYAPVNVQYTLPSGKVVKLLMTTDYPFNDVVTLEVGAVELMTISLRIPSWADGASVQINGSTPVPAKPGTEYTVTCTMHIYVHCMYCVHIINPQRACAERVTVVVSCLCVCLYVCLSAHAILAVHTIKNITKDTVVLSVRFAAILKWRFS